MKSLSILPLLFVAIQALWIADGDYGIKNPETISQGGDLTLYCTANQEWAKCKFTHENGKSCTINRNGEEFDKESDCSDNNMTNGGGSNRRRCEVDITNFDINNDGGKWTCTMTKGKHDTYSRDIQVSQKPEETTTPGNASQVINTKETPTLMGVRSAILAFTFLLTAVFVAGCLVLLPKSLPLLKDQCCSWK